MSTKTDLGNFDCYRNALPNVNDGRWRTEAAPPTAEQRLAEIAHVLETATRRVARVEGQSFPSLRGFTNTDLARVYALAKGAAVDVSPAIATPEPEFTAPDGTVRKRYYGEGKQPWDVIVEAGWGAAFAAGNVLKYVRRHAAKNGADDLAKARWYYAELLKLSSQPEGTPELPTLLWKLTEDEIALLQPTQQETTP